MSAFEFPQRSDGLWPAIARVRDTWIGIEDHGLFTLDLQFEGKSWGQGVGHLCVGESEALAKLVKGILGACNVYQWEKVRGRTIIILRDGGEYRGRIVGIAPLPTENGEEYLFASAFEGQEERRAA